MPIFGTIGWSMQRTLVQSEWCFIRGSCRTWNVTGMIASFVESESFEDFKDSVTAQSEIARIHVNPKGKVNMPLVKGYKYFLTIVEEYRRYSCTSPMVPKEEASELVLNFDWKFERQTSHTIRKIHRDAGSEFCKAYKFLERQGVELSTSTVYTHQSNGLVKRMHGGMLQMIRSCLLQSKLPSP